MHAYASTFSPSNDDNLHHVLQPDLATQAEPHPLALIGKHIFGLINADPDTIHLHEALQQDDRDEFVKAMRK